MASTRPSTVVTTIVALLASYERAVSAATSYARFWMGMSSVVTTSLPGVGSGWVSTFSVSWRGSRASTRAPDTPCRAASYWPSMPPWALPSASTSPISWAVAGPRVCTRVVVSVTYTPVSFMARMRAPALWLTCGASIAHVPVPAIFAVTAGRACPPRAPGGRPWRGGRR